jgi:hypothetical protein
MPYAEFEDLPHLVNQWVAIDPRGAEGRDLPSLRSGAAVIDWDLEIDELCRRLAENHQTSLTIVFCGDRPRA